MGGYVTFPGGLMASLLNKPLMLVNADAALLMSNKALLPVADCIAFGFDGDAGKKIMIPTLALWGDAGIARAAATPLDTWKNWATNVSGSPVDSGHFLTEENPEATARALKEFFTGS